MVPTSASWQILSLFRKKSKAYIFEIVLLAYRFEILEKHLFLEHIFKKSTLLKSLSVRLSVYLSPISQPLWQPLES
jgi:hypothetical protein